MTILWHGEKYDQIYKTDPFELIHPLPVCVIKFQMRLSFETNEMLVATIMVY